MFMGSFRYPRTTWRCSTKLFTNWLGCCVVKSWYVHFLLYAVPLLCTLTWFISHVPWLIQILEFFFYIFHKSFCTQVKGSIMCITYSQKQHFYGKTYYVDVERKEQETPPPLFNNSLLISRWQSCTTLSKLHALSQLLQSWLWVVMAVHRSWWWALVNGVDGLSWPLVNPGNGHMDIIGCHLCPSILEVGPHGAAVHISLQLFSIFD